MQEGMRRLLCRTPRQRQRVQRHHRPTSSVTASRRLQVRSTQSSQAFTAKYCQLDSRHRCPPSPLSTSSTSSNNAAAPNPNLAPRSSAARTRSVSPAKGYGLPASQVRYATPPLINSAGFNPDRNSDRWKDDDFGKPKTGVSAYDSLKLRKNGVVSIVLREAWTSIFRVAWIVTLVYGWLVYYG